MIEMVRMTNKTTTKVYDSYMLAHPEDHGLFHGPNEVRSTIGRQIRKEYPQLPKGVDKVQLVLHSFLR